MSQSFSNKDYAEYFSQLENKISNESLHNTPNLKIVKRKPRRRLNKLAVFSLCFVTFLLVGAIILTTSLLANNSGKKNSGKVNNVASDIETEKVEKIIYPFKTKSTLTIGGEIDCGHIVVMKSSDHSITAMKDPFARAYPASTTKIMTLLTAIDYIEDFDDTFTMTYQITDPLFEAGATVAGFSAGEVITIEDMLYGIILPSGGDASIGIAEKLAGSEKEFVKLMNKKAKELGLRNTNFTNCTGLFDSKHYTTAADMAIILSEAIKNPLCKKILSTYEYTTKPTAQHPEGIPLASTLFNHMYGTEPKGADILGGKTGFVNESGYCIASFGENDDGDEYIVVTLEASSKWPAFYGQIDLYSTYVGKTKNSDK